MHGWPADLKNIERIIAHEGATSSDAAITKEKGDFGPYNKAFLDGIGDAVLARTPSRP